MHGLLYINWRVLYVGTMYRHGYCTLTIVVRRYVCTSMVTVHYLVSVVRRCFFLSF